MISTKNNEFNQNIFWLAMSRFDYLGMTTLWLLPLGAPIAKPVKFMMPMAILNERSELHAMQK